MQTVLNSRFSCLTRILLVSQFHTQTKWMCRIVKFVPDDGVSSFVSTKSAPLFSSIIAANSKRHVCRERVGYTEQVSNEVCFSAILFSFYWAYAGATRNRAHGNSAARGKKFICKRRCILTKTKITCDAAEENQGGTFCLLEWWWRWWL